jgi:outer membrane protein TolC
MVRKIMVICLFVSLVGASAKGGEKTKVFTLKEAVERALARSPSIRSAREGIKGANHLRKAALTDFFPTLRTEYQYRRLGEEPFFQTGPVGLKRVIGTQDNYAWNTGLDQPLFRGGALYWSYRLAKLGVDLSRVFLELASQDLILQVKEIYFTILKAEKIREVALRSVEQLENGVKVSKAFYEVGNIRGRAVHRKGFPQHPPEEGREAGGRCSGHPGVSSYGALLGGMPDESP